jgi:2'-5' RNA ligase
MALLALSYPSISDVNRTLIQAIREQHDPNYAIVAPHFTLVFPLVDQERALLSEHLHRILQGQEQISFVLRCALVVKDVTGDSTHTFLVPDEGFSDLVKLHDHLYTGFLAEQLRLDIPFIPHITVASSRQPEVCKRVADEINSQNISIRGTIRTVALVEYANNRVMTLEQIALG